MEGTLLLAGSKLYFNVVGRISKENTDQEISKNSRTHLKTRRRSRKTDKNGENRFVIL